MKYLVFIFIMTTFMACQSADFKSVDVQQFEHMIEETTVVRLDVRTAAEYAEGHIPGAMLIDAMQPQFVEQVKQQITTEQPIALYCRSGRRSKQAASLLAAEGYTVVELNTGFLSWMESGNMVEK